jgi:hypothetical protein
MGETALAFGSGIALDAVPARDVRFWESNDIERKRLNVRDTRIMPHPRNRKITNKFSPVTIGGFQNQSP